MHGIVTSYGKDSYVLIKKPRFVNKGGIGRIDYAPEHVRIRKESIDNCYVVNDYLNITVRTGEQFSISMSEISNSAKEDLEGFIMSLME